MQMTPEANFKAVQWFDKKIKTNYSCCQDWTFCRGRGGKLSLITQHNA